MSTLGYILLFTSLGSIVSLVGGFLLLFREKIAVKISHYLASFAAGTLLGTAFFDLLPEAAHEGEALGINVFLWTLIGILFFFLLERYIHWFHHHHEHTQEDRKSVIPLVVLGDTFHNMIDGIVIAATVLVDVRLGMVTALAVMAHEIPQEIGDFGIMLHRGISRKKILLINVLSAASAILAGVITYYIGGSVESLLPIFLSLAAGFFIYIAASDLIPEIHGEDRKGVALIETVLLFVGVLVIWIAVSFLEHGF